jgi:hypothetical protein
MKAMFLLMWAKRCVDYEAHIVFEKVYQAMPQLYLLQTLRDQY